MDGDSKNQSITLQELREIVVGDLLENDEYYQAISTPLKSAESCKAEHQASLCEAVKMEKFQADLNEAVEVLIKQMPSFIGEEAWQEMLAECADFNFSEKTLDQIYKLGRALLEKKCFNEASPIFLFMVYLNPKVPDYWLGIGIALYSSQKYQEALAFLKIAVILQPEKAAALIYTTLSHMKLRDHNAAKKSLEEISKKPIEEKNTWTNEIDFINKQLMKVKGD
jgi:tetratricopeptide (TPR) repeat protein